MILGIFSPYFRVRHTQDKFFHLTEILLLALHKVLGMIFVKSVFVLLATDFLQTGKGFGVLRTCNGCHYTDHIAIPSNARISLLFRFQFKAGSFRWTAPPPAWTPDNGGDERTVKYSVLNGSTNVALTWNYTLGTGEFVSSTAWKLDEIQIAFVAAVTKIKDDRFDVHKSEVATLIIKNVSELEDATIQCAVQTDVDYWKYGIRLEITGA